VDRSFYGDGEEALFFFAVFFVSSDTGRLCTAFCLSDKRANCDCELVDNNRKIEP